MDEKFIIEVEIEAPIHEVWERFTDPEQIVLWNNATPDWHTVSAENDLQIGGAFSSRMEARNGSVGFTISGVYDDVVRNESIAYTLTDGRVVDITFTEVSSERTKIVEVVEPDAQAPIEKQQAGWQSILDNFKRYVEAV
jgi:uncharacterized protein YndB with AHSA1/START domain